MTHRLIEVVQRFWVVPAIVVLLVTGMGISTAAADPPRHVWEPIELTFQASSAYENPFDYTRFALVTVWTSPSGREFRVPGFWDGGLVWRNRFTPTMKGVWRYRTEFHVASDQGLHGQTGEITVEEPASDQTEVQKHGGFLMVSKSGRYLTYTDATPFFWLGDTWFRFPCAQIPLDLFKKMVDQRVSQGYTVYAAHGSEPLVPGGAKPMEAILPNDAALQYWQALDPYMSYAAGKGMVGMIGYGAHSMLDSIPEATLKTFFHYHLARYGALPISYFITQEYNAAIGDEAERVPKLLRIGQYLKDIDPYHRALTIHPWIEYKDRHEAWKQPWCDMIWLQAGHFMPAKADLITPAYSFSPSKPVIQAEQNFEGFHRGREVDTDTSVRTAAYTTFQAGGAGFSYGAQGLFAGVVDKSEPLTTAKWGPVLTSSEALQLPGGRQMKYLAAFYQTLHWWNLAPWPSSVGGHPEILVKGSPTEVAIYFPPSRSQTTQSYRVVPKSRLGPALRGRWVNPRDGKSYHATFEVEPDGGLVFGLPPSQEDWLLSMTFRERLSQQKKR